MANFLQLNDPNILNQTRNMSWGQALQTENPFSKSYQGYNPSYKGADRTSLKGYAKQGIESLKGNFLKGSNVGGATPLTRKLALSAMDYAPKALGIASKFLGPASFLFGATPANADEINMTAEDFQNLALQNQTQSLDPTSKNLFSQHGYEEDDEYDFSGIEGQTAGLGVASFLVEKFGPKLGAYLFKIGKNKALNKIGQKVGPAVTGVLTGGQAAQAAQQVQQNIQTYGNRDRPNTGMNAPGAGKSQSPTGGDVSGTPFVRGGRVSYFDGGLLSLWPR